MSTHAHATIGLILLAALLGGCTAGDDALPTLPVAEGYVEPAWMAESRQEEEEGAKAFADCVTQAGWPTIVTLDWGIEPADTLSESQVQMWADAGTVCSRSLWGDLPERTEADWRLKYARALDTRDCLIAHGYTVSDPPSEDSWVEMGLSNLMPWAPFRSILNQINNGTLEMDEQTYYALYAACPQNGPTVSMNLW